MRRTLEEREKYFAKVFTSKTYAGNTFPLDERMNSVGILLTELCNRIRTLEDRLEREIG